MKSLRDSILRGLFRGFNFLARPSLPGNLDYKTARFLVISTTAIGDTLLGTPALRALKETYPDAWVGVLVHHGRQEVLEANPYVDELIPFERGFISMLKLGFNLKNKSIDAALIFHMNDPWPMPIAWLSGAKEIIGHREDTSFNFLLTRTIPLSGANTHAIDHRLTLTRAVGAETSDRQLVFALTEDERLEAKRLIRDWGVDGCTPIVGFQPGASRLCNRWPLERFLTLGRLLIQEMGARIIITGSPQETSMVERLAAMIGPGAVSAAGKTSLRGMAALIEQMEVYVTGDTGPMHIAFSVGTPTVALFCPSDPEALGPSAEKVRHYIISKPMPCSPCITKRCIDPFCMEQFSVDEVAEAVRQVIRSGTSR